MNCKSTNTDIEKRPTPDISVFSTALRSWRNFWYKLHRNQNSFYASIILLVTCIFLAPNFWVTRDLTDIREVIRKHPSQQKILWHAFVSGVNDVIQFQRPAKFILLYTPESKSESERILKDLTVYILNKFQKLGQSPIVLTDQVLNSLPFSEDYGEIIGKYGEELRTKHLMIIKNLNNVSGKAAQAFHALCDEDTPYVPNAVLIFTVKVDKFPEDDNDYVEDLLRRQWSDLDEDVFSPLIARIMSMVLRIHPPYSESNRYSEIKDIFYQLITVFTYIVIVIIPFYLISYYYRHIFYLVDNYPEFGDSIWRHLSKVEITDQFFIICGSEEFKYDVIEYLKSALNLPNYIIPTPGDFKDIGKYCQKNKNKIYDGSLMVIEEIEVRHEVLLSSYREDGVKNVLKGGNVLFVYTVEDTELRNSHLQSFLSEEFLRLIPSKKILSASDF